MDFIAISTAVVLFTTLLAWYALLEYEERRQRKDSEGPKHLPEMSVRKANRERSQDQGADMTRQFRRANGSSPPPVMRSPARSGRRLVFQGMMSGYGLAAVSVLLAYLLVTLGKLLFSFPPLVFFGAAVAFTFTFGGRAHGLFALVLATLLSDFFFVKPTFVFSLDWQVFRLSVFYLLAGLLNVFISKRLNSPTRAH
jgi:K+-sensing histidine kinase KdpD